MYVVIQIFRRYKIFKALEQREPISYKVASLIEEAIRKKKIKLDEKLPSEFELCKQFGVSRTAIREALKILMAKGLVSIAKGKGVYVKKFSPENIIEPLHTYLQLESEDDYTLDVLEARMIIEPSITAYAAMYRTKEDLKNLESDVEELRKCIGDAKAHAKFDVKFHLDIAAASQNPIMLLILTPIQRLMPNIKSKILISVKDAHEAAVVWHQKILDAIEEGNAEKAFKMMEGHLKIAKEHTEKMLKSDKPKK